MDAISRKLACKIFDIARTIAYANLYNVECSAENSRRYRRLLWMYESGCMMTFEVLCELEELLHHIKLEVQCESRSFATSCDIAIIELEQENVYTCGLIDVQA